MTNIETNETQDFSDTQLRVVEWTRKCFEENDRFEIIVAFEGHESNTTRILVSGRLMADFRDCLQMTERMDDIQEVTVIPTLVDATYGTHV